MGTCGLFMWTCDKYVNMWLINTIIQDGFIDMQLLENHMGIVNCNMNHTEKDNLPVNNVIWQKGCLSIKLSCIFI